MSLKYLMVLALAATTAAAADEPYKIEALNEAPPQELAPGVKGVLDSQGFRVVDPEGRPLVDVWLRKGTPATAKPAGPKGAVLYPVLTEGELIGAVKFAAEGHDYRDQPVAAGVYTLRYGLQPVNGDHLGVSVNRDYALLLPTAKDADTADLPRKKLEERSAESVGTTHPGVLLLLAPPDKGTEKPTMVNDATLNTWGAVVSLPLKVEGEADFVPLSVQLVLVGAKTD
ncbi:hypothetical protein [Paludisphaera mucosa]|uniref:DUF4198 domain-containing protein n=1 Tax=Paludisphaera mucosa TaxID=3030827 RepID=A0ABT6F538_9BACT|nr:hypothetical protein [Paludisphaera mucosa]MDG3002624.1 hypothetical protein [Paludisphaera mucosa]